MHRCSCWCLHSLTEKWSRCVVVSLSGGRGSPRHFLFPVTFHCTVTLRLLYSCSRVLTHHWFYLEVVLRPPPPTFRHTNLLSLIEH